jgi:hypothetical protein
MEAQKTALSHWVVVSHWAADDCRVLEYAWWECVAALFVEKHGYSGGAGVATDRAGSCWSDELRNEIL